LIAQQATFLLSLQTLYACLHLITAAISGGSDFHCSFYLYVCSFNFSLIFTTIFGCSGFDETPPFFKFQCEASPSILKVISELSSAAAAGIGLDIKLSVGPRFLGFGDFLFAVWTFGHIEKPD
jgi:hypothetical protein